MSNKSTVRIINNIEMHQDHMIVSLNPGVFPLPVVYSAAESFLETNYLVIRGDPEEEIIVEFRLRQHGDLEQIGREFNNQLIYHLEEYLESEQGEEFMKRIMQRALATRERVEVNEPSYLDDPYDIAKPWEE